MGMIMKRLLTILILLLTGMTAWAQKPGTTPVKVSQEKQMLHGRKYYVHIVEKGQTVYSIARAYKVESYDAVTHVDIHSLHPGDTVWLPFRGQLAEIEEQSAPVPAPAPTPAPPTTRFDTVYVHDTTYVNVSYAVHDTTYVKVPYAVHDTVVVSDTVALTKNVLVHDTAYVNVPYAVHDTVVVSDTVTLKQKEYVTVHDTTYITVHDTAYINVLVHDTAYVNVPYAVHDTVVVSDTVTLTKNVLVHDTAYVNVLVHDTAYVNVPYVVHDTVVVSDTVTQNQKEYVTMHDTTYIAVHDTTYINVLVHDTAIVSDTVTLTKNVLVHDTTFVNVLVRDTAYVNVPYAVHDTVVVSDTVTLTKNVPVHDTTYINVHDTTYIAVHDTTYIDVPYAVHEATVVTDTVTLTEYVSVHDTTYINMHDTTYVGVHDTTYIDAPYAVHDTVVVSDTVTLTKYVPVHDTTYIAMRDTAIVSDTVTLTKSVLVHDTTYITVHDTIIVPDTVTLTKYVPVHDTTYVTVHDTAIVIDTVTLTEYVTVHGTTFVIDTVNYASASDLAFASAAPVAMTEYAPASQPVSIPDSPTMVQPQRKLGKTLKVAVMMPLHLNQLDQISTSKFDIEQRGKKVYRQFEFIEFYEGLLLALDRLAEQGVNVELNVVDVSENSAAKVEEAFISHNVAQSDFVVALLLRDAFDKAAELAQQAGVYIVNPMATRTELCAENPYMVKVQPSVEGMISLMLKNMKVERPNGHLYIIYSNSKAEKAVMDELKRQLDERQDIPYTLFNWSQSAKLAGVLKKTPNCHVLSIFDQDKDNNRVFVGNLLNRLAAFKSDSPTLYTLNDWTRDYIDVDFAQLQLLNYHTFSTSWDMTNDVHINFLQAYRTRFGTEPSSPLAAAGYDLMLYIGNGLSQKNNAFWQSPGNSLPTLIQPMHLSRHGAGLENDKAQLYRLEGLKFVKASFK